MKSVTYMRVGNEEQLKIKVQNLAIFFNALLKAKKDTVSENTVSFKKEHQSYQP